MSEQTTETTPLLTLAEIQEKHSKIYDKYIYVYRKYIIGGDERLQIAEDEQFQRNVSEEEEFQRLLIQSGKTGDFTKAIEFMINMAIRAEKPDNYVDIREGYEALVPEGLRKVLSSIPKIDKKTEARIKKKNSDEDGSYPCFYDPKIRVSESDVVVIAYPDWRIIREIMQQEPEALMLATDASGKYELRLTADALEEMAKSMVGSLELHTAHKDNHKKAQDKILDEIRREERAERAERIMINPQYAALMGRMGINEEHDEHGFINPEYARIANEMVEHFFKRPSWKADEERDIYTLSGNRCYFTGAPLGSDVDLHHTKAWHKLRDGLLENADIQQRYFEYAALDPESEEAKSKLEEIDSIISDVYNCPLNVRAANGKDHMSFERRYLDAQEAAYLVFAAGR